jgi:hypothetical protein
VARSALSTLEGESRPRIFQTAVDIFSTRRERDEGLDDEVDGAVAKRAHRFGGRVDR